LHSNYYIKIDIYLIYQPSFLFDNQHNILKEFLMKDLMINSLMFNNAMEYMLIIIVNIFESNYLNNNIQLIESIISNAQAKIILILLHVQVSNNLLILQILLYMFLNITNLNESNLFMRISN
jgi:hypothetical protein